MITPLVGIFGIDAMQTWSIQVGPATLNYGLFLTALLNFVIVAAIIFFIVVKPMNADDFMRVVREIEQFYAQIVTGPPYQRPEARPAG